MIVQLESEISGNISEFPQGGTPQFFDGYVRSCSIESYLKIILLNISDMLKIIIIC